VLVGYSSKAALSLFCRSSELDVPNAGHKQINSLAPWVKIGLLPNVLEELLFDGDDHFMDACVPSG